MKLTWNVASPHQQKTWGSCQVVFVQQRWNLKVFWVILREAGEKERHGVFVCLPKYLLPTDYQNLHATSKVRTFLGNEDPQQPV